MNKKFEIQLSENGRRLEVSIVTSLTVNGIPTEEEVLTLATQLRQIPLYSVSDDEFSLVLLRIHEALRLDMGLGSRIVNEYEPWLQARKPDIQPFYWSRYQTDLRKQGWGPKVLNGLDKVTDEMLDLLGNPAGNEGWPRRGLVMGDVQSGKTSNYTGLICKASDAGYKLIILLTGTLESLRRQTQERLDWGFVGLDSSGVLNRNKQRREIGVGLINGIRAAGVFTSTVADFRANTVNQLGFKLSSFSEPVLLVVKKNKKILQNLTEWLLTYNADQSGKIDVPMLLVDDESDNASVNTNQNTVTAINAGIRGLLNLFPKSSYVGFTATPFANVFINPDSNDAMAGDDLFPRDFIYALDAPTNYVGASRIFGDENTIDCIRPIEDANIAFPKGLKAGDTINHIPASLVEALHCFVVANAVMDLKQSAAPKHRSMLVNVSHLSKIQDQVRDILDEILRRIQEDIRNFASLPSQEALQNETILSLRKIFDQEYKFGGFAWPDIQSALTKAALPIEVRSVNQNAGPGSLDYSQYKQNGLRVVAVGGNSLSRGLTLEGLVISYFYRSTQMYDTLLQMGRWFGYRPGYEDIFRIWMTDEARDWYSYISNATDELRDEVKRMQVARLKPIDFGLKVRSHPESLLITARNKMYYTEEITRFVSISSEAVESVRLLSDEDVIASNSRSACRFVKSIRQSTATQPSDDAHVYQGVPRALIVEFLRAFTSHPLNVNFQARDIAEFVESSNEECLHHWDVSIPTGRGASFSLGQGIEIPLRKRIVEIEKERRALLINGDKMRVGSRGDEKAGLNSGDIALAEKDFWSNPDNAKKQSVPDHAYRRRRKHPLLTVHFIQGMGRAPESEKEGVPYTVPTEAALVALGLSFPVLSTDSCRVTYRINLVELRNMLASESEEAEAADDMEQDDAD